MQKNRMEECIQAFQRAMNQDGYTDEEGRQLLEDGVWNTQMEYALQRIYLYAIPHFRFYLTGSTGQVVRWYQAMLNREQERGTGQVKQKHQKYQPAINGRFDRATRQATISFQRENQLEKNKIAGPEVLRRLLGQYS